jgi:hypothetical protein
MGVNAVVALSAAQGTGKTQLSVELARQLDCPHASVSAAISACLLLEGYEPSPRLLRERGAQWARYPSELVRVVLAQHKWMPGAPLVFDSIRHAEVLTALRDKVAPQPVLHVGLRVPEDVREARFRERNREPFDPSLGEHSTEVQVPELVMSADIVVDGTSDVGQMASEVLAALVAMRR